MQNSNGKYGESNHTWELRKSNEYGKKGRACIWTQSLAQALLLVVLESQSPRVPIFLSPRRASTSPGPLWRSNKITQMRVLCMKWNANISERWKVFTVTLPCVIPGVMIIKADPQALAKERQSRVSTIAIYHFIFKVFNKKWYVHLKFYSNMQNEKYLLQPLFLKANTIKFCTYYQKKKIIQVITYMCF